jgi:hypothetical protein
MGYIDQQTNKTRSAVLAAIQTQATEAGLRVIGTEERDVGQADTMLGGLARVMFGGRLSIDHVQIIRCEYASGRPWTYVQPFAGWYQLPGEHYISLSGAPEVALDIAGASWFGQQARLRLLLGVLCVMTIVLAPVAWHLWFGVPRARFSRESGALGVTLNQDVRVKRALKRLKFSWAVGRTVVHLPWLVQVFSQRGRDATMVVNAGRYGGFTIGKVGFREVLQLATAISLRTAAAAPTAPRHPLAFAQFTPRALAPQAATAEMRGLPATARVALQGHG